MNDKNHLENLFIKNIFKDGLLLENFFDVNNNSFDIKNRYHLTKICFKNSFCTVGINFYLFRTFVDHPKSDKAKYTQNIIDLSPESNKLIFSLFKKFK